MVRGGSGDTDGMDPEQELKRLADIIREAPQFIGTATPEGDVIDLNPVYSDLHGLSPEDIDRISIDFLHSEVALKVIREEAIPEALESGTWTGENTLRLPDGSDFPVQQTIIAHRDDRGNLQYFSTIMQDISELKQSQLELQERYKEQSCLRSILEVPETEYDSELDLVGKIAALIPSGYQNPDRTHARIRYGDEAVESPGFNQTDRHQTCDILLDGDSAGRVEVYVEPKEDGRNPPFLPEEQALLETIAEQIASKLQRRKAERALRESEQRFRQLAENIEEDFWLSTVDKQMLYVSPAFEDLWGIPSEDIYDDLNNVIQRIHPEDRDRVERAMREQQVTGDYDERYRIIRPDGEERWIHDRAFPITNEEGDVHRIAGLAQDITDQVRQEERLKQLALYDELTELPNRTLFENRLETTFFKARRYGEWDFGLIFLDLDDFKVINDLHGHSIGDEILRTLGHRFQELCRPEDTVARFGGDEFLFLLQNVDQREELRNVARRIQTCLEEPIKTDVQSFTLSASMGICPAGSHYDSPEEMIRDADLTMFRAKRSPERDFLFFTDEFRDRMQSRLDDRDRLERALSEHEFVLYYQPIVELDSARVVGLEALARWIEPDGTVRNPAEFFPIAEACNLLPDLEHELVDRFSSNLRERKESLEASSISWMCLNVSSQMVGRSEFISVLEDRIPPDLLSGVGICLELTEKTNLTRDQLTLDHLERLVDSGFQLLIDDFGTGFSSLQYLIQLSVVGIKIDKAFVRNLLDDPKAHAVTEASLKLAESLELLAAAEGVETEQQLQVLDELGCRFYQGFYHSRPEPIETVIEQTLSVPRT